MQGLSPVARIGQLAADHAQERVQLRLVRRGEPLQEPRPGLRRGAGAVRLGRGQRRAVVQADGELVQLPGQLHPYVVPGAVAPGRGGGGERPVVQGEQDGGGVHVPGRPEHRGPGVGPGGVHLAHLPARHPAQDVEVVHEAVAVQPAGEREVGGGRRGRVRGGRPHGVQPAEPPLRHRRPRLAVPRVEAPHEAELEHAARRLDLRQGGQRAGQVQRDRLLAEDRQPGAGRSRDEPGVGRGRRTDHHGVGQPPGPARPGEQVLHRDGRRPGPYGGARRPFGVRVRQQQGVHDRVAAQRLRMECADPSRSDQSDAHGPKVSSARSSCQAFVLTNGGPPGSGARTDVPWLCPDKRTTLAP